MAWLRNLVKTGDSIMVTVPASVARRWKKAGVIAVLWELEGETLRATPQVLVEHRYHRLPALGGGPLDAARDVEP